MRVRWGKAISVLLPVAFVLYVFAAADWSKALNAEFVVLGQTGTGSGGTDTNSGTTGTGTGGGTTTVMPIPRLLKWSDSWFPIPWRLSPVQSGIVTGQRALVDVIRSSFQAWQSVSTAQVSFQEGEPIGASSSGFDQINQITFSSSSALSGIAAMTLIYYFDSSGGLDSFGRTIEFPGQISEADIILNSSFTFSTDLETPSGLIDLESVAVHEIGHLLGLGHSGLSSAAMFPAAGHMHTRMPGADDAIALSKLYPANDFHSLRGGIAGIVRTSSGSPVFGAHVVAVDSVGRPVASGFTDPTGSYQILGLTAGAYSAYVEPLDEPASGSLISFLVSNFPNLSAFTNFTTRFNTVSQNAPLYLVTKSAGDNQAGNMGEQLVSQLEVLVTAADGTPVSGVTVNLLGTSGGATVVPYRGSTDGLGKIRAAAYLGTGLVQTFTAYAGSGKTTFTATVNPPVLTSMTAGSGVRGSSFNVGLSGKNFVKGATTVSMGGTGVTITGVNVTKPTSLSATFNIGATAAATTRPVTVTGPNGTSGALNFTVQ